MKRLTRKQVAKLTPLEKEIYFQGCKNLREIISAALKIIKFQRNFYKN